MKTFDANNLSIPIDKFKQFTSKAITRAYRVDGPFTLPPFKPCQDGYIVLNARRMPSPMSKEEFERLYKPIKQTKKTEPKPESKTGE